MTTTDNVTRIDETTTEQPTQKQIVEDLISKKKKSSSKQEIAEFAKEWSKLAREEGVSNNTVGLLMDGFSIAGASPLFSLMKTDESCLTILDKMRALRKIEENPLGASLRIYVHLLALAVNAGRSRGCINSIISAIPKHAYNKEGKPFGTNPATISKYLLRELNARKASEVLAGVNLQESTANKLVTIFSPAFSETVSKRNPTETETSAAKVLRRWLESKTTKTSASTAHPQAADASQQDNAADSDETEGAKAFSKLDTRAEGPAAPTDDAKTEESKPLTYDSVVDAIRKLEHSHAVIESRLSSAEKTIRAKDEAIERLKASLEEAHSRVTSLTEGNNEKQRQIDNANRQIEKLQHDIEETKSTADARAEMIAMLDKNRDQKGSEALARIASKLKADYGDFKEYEGEAMTIELGEIVKLQLGQIFETLKSAGVKL